MSLAVVIEGMALIAYMVILAGGVQKRASGWRILCGLLLLVAAVELTGMSLMVSGMIPSTVPSKIMVEENESSQLTPWVGLSVRQ